MSTQLTKRALFSKGALSAGVGLGTLALFQQHASADTPFTAFAFAATGAPTPRTMPDRLAEVVNVKDFGATGNGSTDDSTFIQNAFDAAFKDSGGVPHGTNSYLNRAVYFPAGNYQCHNLTLTQVQGGRIYGAGQLTTTLTYNGPHTGGPPLLRTNGFAYSTIENMRIAGYGRSDGLAGSNDIVALDLSTGSGGIGLHDCMIINVGVGSSLIGCRIAENGFGGQGITFLSCGAAEAKYGFKQNSDTALVNVVGGGQAQCEFGYWVKKGSLFVSGAINAGIYQAGSNPGQTDILHESSGITTFVGCRCESQGIVYITNALGKVNLVGVLHNQYNVGPDGLGPKTVNGTAGQVSLNGVFMGNDGVGNTGLITGAVTVSLRNVRWGLDENHFPGFTGKVANYLSTTPFTMATLPPNPVDGLMVSVSNANASGAWGSNVTGTGSDHALLRWNALTSQWTLVGK